MSQVNRNTEHLLKQSQEYRDSDKKLLLAYWEQEGFYLTESQRRTFLDCTPAESITRARRNLRPLYPATKAVEDERFKQFINYRENAPYANEELL